MGNEDYTKIPVKFYYRDVKQNFESKKQGKNIWKTCEFICIMKPGNSKDIMDREVKQLDIDRWGPIYNAWKKREEQVQSGTRLEVLPGIEEGRIDLCKSLHIYTLEQLVSIDEDGVANLGLGARDLILEAKRYLQGTSAVKDMEKEVHTIKAENKKLQEKNKELEERINELINNGTERSKRDATSGSTSNGNRKQRPVRKAIAVTVDKSGPRAVSAT